MIVLSIHIFNVSIHYKSMSGQTSIQIKKDNDCVDTPYYSFFNTSSSQKSKTSPI